MPEMVQPLPMALLVIALGYLLGSVPFGVLMAKAFGLGDLRAIGSGNIGATNVLRTGNRKAAALTLVLDAAKGGVAVALARLATGDEALAHLAGAAAFLGHIFPVWLGFRGGKGVATFLGTLLVAAWPVGLAACASWLVVALATRYSSAASLVSAAAAPMFAVLLGRSELLMLTTFLCLAIWISHRQNIRRLKDGTETRIGRKAAG